MVVTQMQRYDGFEDYCRGGGAQTSLVKDLQREVTERKKFMDSGLQKQMNVYAICENMKPRFGIVLKEGSTEEHYDMVFRYAEF